MRRRRPSSRSKSCRVKERSDRNVLYETVIIKNSPAGIFISLRPHVAGNSRFPASNKRCVCVVAVVVGNYEMMR
jgi:hypothetical protein